MASGRIAKIDALKCVAMFFVILGHAIVFNSLFPDKQPGAVLMGAQWIQTSTLNSFWLNVAYSFHMPLFAFLSSYVLFGREGSPLALLGKRAIALMLPYFVWVGVSYVVGGSYSASGFARFVLQRALYPQSPGAAWFLYALFLCFVAFAIVRALGGGTKLLVASAILSALLIVLPIPGGDILGVFDFAWLYPFFVMGYLFAKYASNLEPRRISLMAGGALVWAALLPFIWPVLVPEMNWWYPGARAALHRVHLPGAIVALYGVRYLCAAGAVTALFFLYDYVLGKAVEWQAWAGRRTLGMYVIQPYVLLLVSLYVTKNWVVLTIAAFVGSLLGAWLLEQNRYTRLVFLGQRTRRVPVVAPPASQTPTAS